MPDGILALVMSGDHHRNHADCRKGKFSATEVEPEIRVNAEDTDHILRAQVVTNSSLLTSLFFGLHADMKNVRKWCSQLYDINRDLVSQYKIRCNNHKELMDTLKEVNQVIQKAARLRIGKSKSTVVSECRNSIKTNNINQLVKVIKTGIP